MDWQRDLNHIILGLPAVVLIFDKACITFYLITINWRFLSGLLLLLFSYMLFNKWKKFDYGCWYDMICHCLCSFWTSEAVCIGCSIIWGKDQIYIIVMQRKCGRSEYDESTMIIRPGFCTKCNVSKCVTAGDTGFLNWLELSRS